MTSRSFVLFAATVFILSAGAVLGWRVAEWHARGWTGVRYAGATSEARVASSAFGSFLPGPGEVVSVLPGSPAEQAGIRVKETISAVNGIPIADQPRMAALSRSMRRGDVIRYTVEGRGTIGVRSVSPMALPTVAVNALTNYFLSIVFIAASVFVYWHNPRSRAARVFVLLCAVGAAGFALGAIVEFELLSFNGVDSLASSREMAAMYGAYAILALALMNLLLHFSLIFPKPLPLLERQPRLLVWIHTLPFLPAGVLVLAIAVREMARVGNHWAAGAACLLLSAACIVAAVMRRYRGTPLLAQPWTLDLAIVLFGGSALFFMRGLLGKGGSATAGFVVGILFAAFYIGYIALASLLTMAALIIGYRGSSLEEKRQVRWPLWGTVVAIGTSAVLSTVMILLTRYISPDSQLAIALGFVLRLSYVLIPVSFAFGILKYRVMEIDVLIRKTVVYSFVTGLGVLVFFAAVAGAGSYLTGVLGIRNQTLTIVTTLVLVAISVPIRNRLQKALDRKFFQRDLDAGQTQHLLGQELVRSNDLPQFLTRATEIVQQKLSARWLVALVREPEADALSPAASIGLPEHVVRDLGLEVTALRSAGGVCTLGDLRLTDEERAILRRAGTALVVPLAIRGKIVGTLLAGPRLRGSYDEDERQFFSAVASQLALGIDNLSVSVEARDLERAREIQRALLPRHLPQIAGLEIDARWVPARTVGGDYFDVFPAGDRVALCIADVAGKGMPAALLMATLQAAVRATVHSGIEPDEVCRRVSSVVTGTLEGGRFITFFFALLDTRTRTIRYTNAGHNPPLLVRRDGSVVRLQAGGPVFARLMRGAAYRASEERLADGDRLVLFTDGVTEARNADEDEFGEERLVAAAASGTSAREMLESIVARVAAFSPGAAADDLTLVCVRAVEM